MPAIRLWILAVALGCFAAGMVVGTSFFAQHPTEDHDRDYADQLAKDYGLSNSQLRSLRLVLQNERAEERAIRASIEWSQLPPALQSRLLKLRAQTRNRIRVLLDPEQGARFDRDSQPAAATSIESDKR